MKQTIITSVHNSKIKEYKKLLFKKFRDVSNFFIVEGEHLVNEAKKHNLIYEIITTNRELKGTIVSDNVLKTLTTTKTPQNIIAICYKLKPKTLGKKVLGLSNIQDPGNVGTLIRSAKCFNFDSVIVEGVDIYNSKVIRASRGAIFTINVLQTNNLSQYFLGYQIIGAVLDKKALNYQDFLPKKPFMIVLGNESKGLSLEIIKQLNYKIYIPIHFESLNVASAGAILLNAYQK